MIGSFMNRSFVCRICFPVFFISLISCSEINYTTGGALTGTAVGSGLGAIIGSTTGHTGAGTAVGAGVGAVAGTLIGSVFDETDRANKATARRVSDTQSEIARNQELIEELRSRGADALLTNRGVLINLPDVLFGFNKSNLSRDANDTVGDIAKVLREKVRDRSILIEGHTDAIGSDRYNYRLSESRADSVARALIRNGVNRGQIRSKGFGESRPISANANDSGRARNRRVEIIVER